MPVLDVVKHRRDDNPVSSHEAPLDARSALLAAARAELEEHGVVAVSLRAVARRAGLSHASPGYFFGDRAGMLTALATEGFAELAEALGRASALADGASLTLLGTTYIDFGLSRGALFDLMFQRDFLHSSDPDLQAARQRALALLVDATGAGSEPTVDTLMSWALVHGLVTLARQHALPTEEDDVVATARRITKRFAQVLGSNLKR